MVDFNKCHLILTGRVHRFGIYKIFFLRCVLAAGEGGTGEQFNLPNTCPKWTSWDALEWHWPADHEYINFWAVGALWAEILSPEFPNFGRNSKMAADMGASMLATSKKIKKINFFFFFFF